MLAYTFIPMAAAVLSAVIAVLRRPGRKLTSVVQHLAAGVVFAAAVGEILPEILNQHGTWPIVIGGTLGIAATYGIKWVHCYTHGPAAFVASVGIDTLVDGIVIGIGFVLGAAQGLLLTFALTLEILFLGLAMTSTLADHLKGWQIVALSVGIGALFPIGALIGGVVGGLPTPYVVGFYSFGLMALLYLVTEELLVEADRHYDTPATTVVFFVGFLLVILLEHTVHLDELDAAQAAAPVSLHGASEP